MKTGPRLGRYRSSLETGEYRAEEQRAQGKPDCSADSAPLRELLDSIMNTITNDYDYDRRVRTVTGHPSITGTSTINIRFTGDFRGRSWLNRAR